MADQGFWGGEGRLPPAPPTPRRQIQDGGGGGVPKYGSGWPLLWNQIEIIRIRSQVLLTRDPLYTQKLTKRLYCTYVLKNQTKPVNNL